MLRQMLILMLILFYSATGNAAIYKCRDFEGNIVYLGAPCSFKDYDEITVKQKRNIIIKPVWKPSDADSDYDCDAKVRCSQMTSCEDFRQFAKHCKSTRIDLKACEMQWCR